MSNATMSENTHPAHMNQKMEAYNLSDSKPHELSQREWEQLEELGEALKKQLTYAQHSIATNVSSALSNINLSKKEMNDWKTLEDLGESLKEDVVQAQNLILTSVHAAIAKTHRSKSDALEELGDSLREQVTHAQESIRASVSTALENLRNDDLFEGLLDKKEQSDKKTDKKKQTPLEEVVCALKEERSRTIEKEMSERKALEEMGEMLHECCDLANETIMTSVTLALAQLDLDKINKEMRDWHTLEQLGGSLKEYVNRAQEMILDSVSSSLANIHQEALHQAPEKEQVVRRRGMNKENEGEERRRSAAIDKGLGRQGKNKETDTDVNKENDLDGVKKQRTQQWKAVMDQLKIENPAPAVSAPKQIETFEEPSPGKLDQIREVAGEAAKAAFKKDVERAVRKDEAAITALRKDVLRAALGEESI